MVVLVGLSACSGEAVTTTASDVTVPAQSLEDTVAVPEPSIARGLVAHYPLDGNADDAVGTSDGRVSGAIAAPDRAGAVDSALFFNGVDAFVEIEHSDALSLTNEFTIAAWINLQASDDAGEFWTIFEKSDPERGGHSRYGLWVRDGLLWTCFEAADNSQQPCTDTSMSLSAGSWHHVAAVRSGRRLILYLDGEEVANGFVGLRDVSETAFNGFIGTDRYEEPAVWLHGTVDDLRIYDRPLTTTELQQLAQ
jgi:hypothetical protein